jgi:hypothetical protein
MAYEHWRSVFAAEPPAPDSEATLGVAHGCTPLRGRRIPLSDVPCLLDYDRGHDLELWELVLVSGET